MRPFFDDHDAAGRGPLSGLTVLDLTRALAGPHAAMMLGDLGATVIKVERPGGDDSRGWGPPFVQGESTYFLSANRNKRSITLDLASPDGRQTIQRLVEHADVLLENFRPGVLDRLGLPVRRLAELNPRLVVLSITGFGHDGPEADRPGYDQVAQGEAGLMALTGARPDDPQRVGVPVADLLAGIHGAYGVLAALIDRHRTGRGQVVRTSLLAGVVGVHAFQGTRWTVAGQRGRAEGNHHPSICPYGLFRTRDGAVQLAVGSQDLWKRFCAEFGLDSEAGGMAANADRVVRRDEVIALIERLFAEHDTGPLLGRLGKAGIPAGRVRGIDEVYQWEQTRSQGLLLDVRHQKLGDITLPGPPLRFFDLSGEETTFTGHTAPPVLGADSDAVRAWLTEAEVPR